SDANFGIKGALAAYRFQCGFEFEVAMTNSRRKLIGTSNSPHWAGALADPSAGQAFNRGVAC
ncbi:hypothetical protein, partial [Bradyrhizobium sp.]|uniref:hypothetical protein n=1 Tax=Bradyrhizobium sp. TaxID=376 RepID=UPI002638079A